MKKLCFAFALLCTTFLSAQVTIKDDAKVGLLVTGTGNTINTTQIFGKSPEYAELKKRLDGLQAAITQKAEECGQMEKDALPAKYRDLCRTALIALNAERDSVQKIEARFREDVLRLAETFANIPLNSERLRLAKQLFDEGKIREADNILNAKEMQQEGDALLAKKERAQQTLQMTDSLLRIKADEFALKARLKATDYGDSLRYDSAVIYFEQSRKYAETVDNLWAFADLLGTINQALRAIPYYERALQLARSESEEALLTMNLGIFYFDIQKIGESEKMYLQSISIIEHLVKNNSIQFEPDLALVAMNLGILYANSKNISGSESMLLRSFDIYERLSKDDSMHFEPKLAIISMNLGNLYQLIKRISDSKKMYLRSLEIYERLAKIDPTQFEPDLAMTCANLGNLYKADSKLAESEKMYLRSLEIYGRLIKIDPSQFEPYLAEICMHLGAFYKFIKKMPESEKLYMRSLATYERLVKNSPAQFEPSLALVYRNVGNFYYASQKILEAEKMYICSFDAYSRLVENKFLQFEPDLALMAMTLGDLYCDIPNVVGSEKMYLRALNIYDHLSKSKPAQLESDLAEAAIKLAILYKGIQKKEESERMFLRSLEIYDHLAKSNPVQFEPDLVMTAFNLGVFYSDNNQQKEAISIFKRVLTIGQKLANANPVVHTILLAFIFNNLGFAYLKDGDFTNARECLEKYQSIKPDNSLMFRNWACFFALQNDIGKAIENLNKAATLGYDDPDWIKKEKSLDGIREHSSYPAILKIIEENKRLNQDK